MNTFWITDGVNQFDEWRVVVKTDQFISCSHCFADKQGFKYVGNERYAICNNCLYRPSKYVKELHFIAVSKNREPESFEKFLEKCENKAEYLEMCK